MAVDRPRASRRAEGGHRLVTGRAQDNHESPARRRRNGKRRDRVTEIGKRRRWRPQQLRPVLRCWYSHRCVVELYRFQRIHTWWLRHWRWSSGFQVPGPGWRLDAADVLTTFAWLASVGLAAPTPAEPTVRPAAISGTAAGTRKRRRCTLITPIWFKPPVLGPRSAARLSPAPPVTHSVDEEELTSSRARLPSPEPLTPTRRDGAIASVVQVMPGRWPETASSAYVEHRPCPADSGGTRARERTEEAGDPIPPAWWCASGCSDRRRRPSYNRHCGACCGRELAAGRPRASSLPAIGVASPQPRRPSEKSARELS
jgi:hypothetical protein